MQKDCHVAIILQCKMYSSDTILVLMNSRTLCSLVCIVWSLGLNIVLSCEVTVQYRWAFVQWQYNNIKRSFKKYQIVVKIINEKTAQLARTQFTYAMSAKKLSLGCGWRGEDSTKMDVGNMPDSEIPVATIKPKLHPEIRIEFCRLWFWVGTYPFWCLLCCSL